MYVAAMQVTASQRIASTVRAELARRRISQTTVGERLGISQAAVSRRLSGQQPLDVNELTALAGLLDMPVSALIEDAAPPRLASTA